MAAFTAVLDACVLYPAPLRDLLMSLAVAGIYRAKWSQQIHDEWTRNLLANRPDLDIERIRSTCTTMNRAVPDCLVTGYENLIGSLSLRDPNDRHVLAVAIRSNATAIITFNQRDFDEDELERYDVYTEHPDEFVSNMLTVSPAPVIEAVREMRSRLTKQPKNAEEFLSTLQQQGLPQFVSQLSDFANAI